MPRPYPPPLLAIPTVGTFKLEPIDQRRIAETLGLDSLPPEIADGIAHAIACLNATRGGSRDTTKGSTLAALAELSCPRGRSYKAAVSRFASDRCGVDYTTLGSLHPLARAVLDGDPQAPDVLAEAAQARAVELRDHPRVASETEARRFFCGVLRVIFERVAAPTVDRTWSNCGAFALAVLTVAGIEQNFDAHPERLKEYLCTDVSSE